MSESAVIDQPSAQTDSEPTKPRKLPPNWEQIEADYIRGATTRELAAKYGVPYGTISYKCNQGQWPDKRALAESIHDQIVDNPDHPIESIQPYPETIQGSSVAIQAIDLVQESLRWKEQTYKRALKIAGGIDAQTFADGESKKLAEVASALASIDATARRQLGLDVSDAEDFGDSPRSTRHKIGERPIMRRAQVIDVAPAVSSTPESFDPST